MRTVNELEHRNDDVLLFLHSVLPRRIGNAFYHEARAWFVCVHLGQSARSPYPLLAVVDTYEAVRVRSISRINSE